MSLLFYLSTSAINLWFENSSQQTPLQCLSRINMVLSVLKRDVKLQLTNQHGIKRRGQDFDMIKSLYLKGYTSKRLTNFLRKAGQSMVLISCSKTCGTHAQLTGGQAAADCAVPVLKKNAKLLLQ